MTTAAATSLESENLRRQTNSGFHRVRMLLILELFPFHGGCTPVCLSFSFNFYCSFFKHFNSSKLVFSRLTTNIQRGDCWWQSPVEP